VNQSLGARLLREPIKILDVREANKRPLDKPTDNTVNCLAQPLHFHPPMLGQR